MSKLPLDNLRLVFGRVGWKGEGRKIGFWGRDTREKEGVQVRGGEPLATLIKIPAVEFYLRRARYWS